MMTMFKGGVVSLVAAAMVSLVFAAPMHAHAVAVGLSPSTKLVQMKEGQSSELSYRLSRSDTTGDFVFYFDAPEDAPHIKAADGEMVTIPAGENGAEYHFDVDTTGLDVGTYETIMTFLEEPKDSDELLAIRYGIQGTLVIDVLDDDAYAAAVREQSVALRGLYLVEGGNAGEQVTLRIDVQNKGDVFIEGVTTRVEVINEDGEIVQRVDGDDVINLNPLESFAVDQPLLIEDAGDYTVRVTAFFDGQLLAQQEGAIRVGEPTTPVEVVASSNPTFYIMLAVAIAFVLLGIVLLRPRSKTSA